MIHARLLKLLLTATIGATHPVIGAGKGRWRRVGAQHLPLWGRGRAILESARDQKEHGLPRKCYALARGRRGGRSICVTTGGRTDPPARVYLPQATVLSSSCLTSSLLELLPGMLVSGVILSRLRRRLEALVGQDSQAVTPVSSRTPTSRSRCATADPPGRVLESPPGAVRAANGTRAGRRSHPRIRGRPHARP